MICHLVGPSDSDALVVLVVVTLAGRVQDDLLAIRLQYDLLAVSSLAEESEVERQAVRVGGRRPLATSCPGPGVHIEGVGPDVVFRGRPLAGVPVGGEEPLAVVAVGGEGQAGLPAGGAAAGGEERA